MHIPSEMLSGGICPVTAAVAAIGIGSATIALFKSRKNLPSAGKFALVSAAIFGIQMLNYPIWDGISGHIVGGVLAATLLGIPAGILSIALVLLLQTLMFADGGILMLGANIINMSLIGAGIGGILRQLLIKRINNKNFATGIAAFLSVELAVLALCAELAIDGKIGLSVCATLIGVHTVLAIVEALATVAIVAIACPSKNESLTSVREYATLSALIVAALCLSPIASAFPDAFEWTMSHFSILPTSANFANAPFADYEISAISNEFVSALCASALGMATICMFGYAIFSFLRWGGSKLSA